MAVKMLGYFERDSVIHRLSGVTKLIIFLLWSTAAMLTYDTRVLLVLFVLGLVIFKLSKVKLKEISVVLVLILFFLLLNNLAIYLFSPQEGVQIYNHSTELFTIYGRYNMTVEQLFYQLNVTLKYIVVTPAALLFIITTQPSEFAASLNKIGVHYKISIAVSLALRYIPDIQRDFRTISQVQQARGVDFSKNEKLLRRLKNVSSVIMPLIFSSLDRIETISQAMELRSFGKHNKRTWYSARPLTKIDWIVLVASVILFTLAMVVTFYDGSRFYNPF
ncbi:energy-coupling factor transporter transmembrane component T family protein [Amphibacillus xylanus]|uniref:Putative ABC transporter permease protein n=1 Tax=Amphibacillus xylanus (strain ATCC 51415 / DSM 6626 / JCM 7361 / LMG 17667 / NBRC 15112 / Ep01) TaxID=698758 RepID=K0J123_AMPXN|nr:energy-coupling factor transporter transmembrane component T [Amphibacillus xylanus]BAM48499.1 putative ABC transporter permease protein [Amphibacillus xylanus NBRC 15112]